MRITDQKLLKYVQYFFPSARSAKVSKFISDQCNAGYGFISFNSDDEAHHACQFLQYMSKIGQTIFQFLPVYKPPVSSNQPGAKDRANSCIFVANLHIQTSEEDIKQLFGCFGKIIDVSLHPAKRFAFVRFHKRESAVAALTRMSEYIVVYQQKDILSYHVRGQISRTKKKY
ncbi:Rna recognition motif-containing protein [Cardiosporidium cionae]|uniref:Rna recognition motif-containing protein n=1 Tax=Cardiosporidium cionae TaxID=476202 RepID=A0ABQ7JBM0_9APIC|nr:Rna recognition motif-containing protein [Cardiosporidium cionae]|eukprot:KAF8821390.1 Rna recognition motif-containing protein [Cardiosporidium cionae]